MSLLPLLLASFQLELEYRAEEEWVGARLVYVWPFIGLRVEGSWWATSREAPR